MTETTRTRSTAKRLALAFTIVLATFVAAVPGADAIGAPYTSGANIQGQATASSAGNFHDIDRKHCDWTGCGWLDGTNTNTWGEIPTTAQRGAYCDTHRYRHQGQNGDANDTQLTYNC